MKKPTSSNKKITDDRNLKLLIKERLLKDLDLTEMDVNGLDFSGCTIENVEFSTKGQKDRQLTDVSFEGACLIKVSFEDAVLDHVDFTSAVLECCSFQQHQVGIAQTTVNKVNFAQSVIAKCRFRDAVVKWSDFRYAEITDTTFENVVMDYCDFYRAHFSSINIFNGTLIGRSSFNFTLFDGMTIRRGNIRDGKLVQEDEEAYHSFLIDWKKNGPGVRKVSGSENAWALNGLSDKMKARHADAENIFKLLNSIWASNGFLGDANWAYVKGRRAERRRLCTSIEHWWMYIFSKKGLRILWNALCDGLFVYGESIGRILVTYAFLVALFSIIIHYAVPNDEWIVSLRQSVQNMIAQTPDVLKKGVGLTWLSIIQSSIGILLTGILGFVIANKIRNQ